MTVLIGVGLVTELSSYQHRSVQVANYTLNGLKPEYLELWHTMQISEAKIGKIQEQADKVISNKEKYKAIEKLTGVPWYFIGLLHLRESNCNFNTHLHNGDPLSARTVHVPKGFPRTGNPPFSFEFSAVDALRYMKLDKVTDWSIANVAFYFEEYNGFGYRPKKVNSPYLWAGTNHYIKGKYTTDHKYNPNAVDQQLGVMPILARILAEESVTNPNVELLKTEITTPAPLSPAADLERPTNKELRETSRKFRITEWLKWLFGITTGGATAAKTLDATNITATKTYMDTIKLFIHDYGVFLFIGGCAVAFFATAMLIKYMKDDVEEGRATPSGEAK